MERQEPVIDSARTLQNRVKLTWREIRDLAVDQKEPMLGTAPSGARPDSVTEAAVPAADPQPVPKASPVATLSDADRAAIAAYLSPRIEEALRSALEMHWIWRSPMQQHASKAMLNAPSAAL